MRTTLNTLAGIFILFGIVWILQGLNILPGSFMTGQIQWTIYGAMIAAVGLLLLVVARRLKR